MRSLLWCVAVTIVSLFLGACATAPATPSAPERQALTPTGKLRVGLFTGQPVHSVRDPATGEYLVGGKTSIRTMAELDQPGVRIAVPQRGAADTYLSKSLRQATLVRTPAVQDAVDLVRKGEVEAMAAVKTFLYPVSDRLAGSRVLDGMIAAEDVTIAVAPGNAAGAAFVRRFIEDAKASGLVRAAMDKARVRGLIAVP